MMHATPVSCPGAHPAFKLQSLEQSARAASWSEQRSILTARYFRNQEPSLLKWVRDEQLELSKVVVQIPARSRSTRLPDKNIRDLCGQPLLAYSAMIATRLKNVDRVIINTDSKQYAEIGEKYGLEAPFLRPLEIAGENSNLAWASYYLIRHLVDANYPVKAIITLLPTSPFRRQDVIQDLVNKVMECGSAYTVARVNALSGPYTDAQGRVLVNPLDVCTNILCCKTIGLFSGEYLIRKHIVQSHVMYVDNPMELIDIDTAEDFQLAEHILDNGLYDFGV